MFGLFRKKSSAEVTLDRAKKLVDEINGVINDLPKGYSFWFIYNNGPRRMILRKYDPSDANGQVWPPVDERRVKGSQNG